MTQSGIIILYAGAILNVYLASTIDVLELFYIKCTLLIYHSEQVRRVERSET